MLDPFRVVLSDFSWDADGLKKPQYDGVPFAAPRGDLLAFLGQKDAPVRLVCDIPLLLEAPHRFGDGHGTDPQPLGEVNGTSLPLLVDQGLDELDIVFSGLSAVIEARPLESVEFGDEPIVSRRPRPARNASVR